MKTLLRIGLVAMATLGATAASAATTYLFPAALTGSPFTVTAGYIAPSGTGAAVVSAHPNGIGVQSPWEAPGSAGAATVDGNPLLTSEFLTVSFNYAVRLDSLQLGAFDGNDEYTLLITTASGSQLSFSNLAFNPVNVNHVTSVTIFAVGTPGIDGRVPGYDDFRLEELTISAVPVPAAAGLLLGGLGLLGLARRRRT